MSRRENVRDAARVAAVPLLAVGGVVGFGTEDASAGNCWPWDQRQVATFGDGTNGTTVITGRQRLCRRSIVNGQRPRGELAARVNGSPRLKDGILACLGDASLLLPEVAPQK